MTATLLAAFLAAAAALGDARAPAQQADAAARLVLAQLTLTKAGPAGAPSGGGGGGGCVAGLDFSQACNSALVTTVF